MLEPRPLAALSLGDARVLLEPAEAQALFGVDLRALPDVADARLVVAVASPERPAAFWEGALAGRYVAPLDVNAAAPTALLRVPGLLPDAVDRLVRARPYFTLDDLRHEGADLAEVARLATPYLAHAGYEFLDKPQGRLVSLSPNPTGVLVRHQAGVAMTQIEPLLGATGLALVAHDPADRLAVCRWTIAAPERPAHLRALKEHPAVVTVAPYLEDAHQQVRLVYPDRFDLALQPGENDRWAQLLGAYELTLVQGFAAGYGSVRVRAHPHDLGALYRIARMLAGEAAVRFTEPTYLVPDAT